MRGGLEALAPFVSNELPAATQAFVTGIVGDRPSRYAKTPPLWNATYQALGWDAVSLPWDVADADLAGFVDAVRATPQIAGFSVTIPFKIAILDLLDEVDPLARQIGAVNTVARRDGTLVGYNTDGQGAIDALTERLPGMARPFLPALDGLHVLMIGAGGAARAVAFFLAERLQGSGSLRIANRNSARAADLAAAVRRTFGVGEAGGEYRVPEWIGGADLVINASTKGQSGWRRSADGSAFMLEPYSALAPAHPPAVGGDGDLDAEASHEWFRAAIDDVDRNAAEARRRTAAMKPGAACFDLVYAPLETRFLADARLAGHPTLNGKWMNIAQAADGFARKVCARALAARGSSVEEGYHRALEVMARVW